MVEQLSDLPSKRRSGLGSVVFVRAIDALVVRHRDSWNKIEVTNDFPNIDENYFNR